MNLSLIKQLNENIREKDEYELALDSAGIKSQPIEENFGPEEDFARLAAQYQEMGADMDTNELIDAIGDDLEMLEYSPDEIEQGIEAVLGMLGRSLSPEENEEEDAIMDMDKEYPGEDEMGDEMPMDAAPCELPVVVDDEEDDRIDFDGDRRIP